MRFNPKAFIPKENRWFSPKVEYSGQAVATFPRTGSSLTGFAKFKYSELGVATVQFSPNRSSAGSTVLLRPHEPVTVEISTDEYTFSVEDAIYLGGGNWRAYRGQYSVNGAGSAKYWVLPLINLISGFEQIEDHLDNHPLRIFPKNVVIPDCLPAAQRETATDFANSKNYLIVFYFRNHLGFIEPVADYEKKKAKLESGEKHALTALMIGEIPADRVAKQINFDQVHKWLPRKQLLSLLGISTGFEVSNSWIEFRDEHGNLVKRLHAQFGLPEFSQGHAALWEEYHPGSTGKLLSLVRVSSPRKNAIINNALEYILKGAKVSRPPLEDRYRNVCIAANMLYDAFGYGQVKLIDQLPDKASIRIRNSKERLLKTIQSVEKHKSKKDPDVSEALTIIIDRISKEHLFEDNHFGRALKRLISSRKFNFPDANILASHTLKTSSARRKVWLDAIYQFRNLVMHQGYFDFPSKQDRSEVLSATQHMLDICLRVVFKELGYDGMYMPSVMGASGTKPLDWVSGESTPTDLGYRI